MTLILLIALLICSALFFVPKKNKGHAEKKESVEKDDKTVKVPQPLSLPKPDYVFGKRPEGMAYEEYRRLLTDTIKKIRRRLKDGFLFYCSWVITQVYHDGDGSNKSYNVQKYMPYVRAK